jgi:hypothetical protein
MFSINKTYFKEIIMQTSERQKKQTSLFKPIMFAVLIIAAISITQNARADFATPFIEINNNIGDVSDAYGYVVADDNNAAECSAFLVIARTDTMDYVVIKATANKGVVAESMIGRWVIIKAQVTNRQIDPKTNRIKEVLLKILSVRFPTTKEKEESAEEIARAKYKDMRDYVKQQDVSYDRTRAWFKKDQLPLLYKLLKDDAYAPYWSIVAQIIGFISDDPNSVPVLLDYFQRNDDSKAFAQGGSKRVAIGGKIWSLAWIGKIGGDQADSILKKAATKEGARELAKAWIDEESKSFQNNNFITHIQRAAIEGLVFSGKKENLDFVEKLYNEQKALSLKNKAQTDLMDSLIDAMACKSCIDDHGIGGYFKIWHSDNLNTLGPYLDKYTVKVQE